MPPRSAAPSDLQPLFALYGARRFGDMEQLAQALLARFPNDGNVWKALSVAQQVQGKDAVPALQQAISLLPRDAELPSNLGALLSDAGRLEEAIDSYRRALSIQPDFADAHGNLGVALTRLGRYADAVASLQRALQLKPAFAEAHNNLANALMGLNAQARRCPITSARWPCAPPSPRRAAATPTPCATWDASRMPPPATGWRWP